MIRLRLRLAGFLYRLADRIATVKRTPLQRKRATKAKP